MWSNQDWSLQRCRQGLLLPSLLNLESRYCLQAPMVRSYDTATLIPGHPDIAMDNQVQNGQGARLLSPARLVTKIEEMSKGE